MSINLEELGISKEEVQDRVIDRICDQLLSSRVWNPESEEEYSQSSQFHREITKRVEERVKDNITAIAEKHLMPNVDSFIEGLILQQTNQWGEKVGQPVTFIEYLTQRAEAYMQEMVSFDGKPRGQDAYNWKGTQTRLTHLVNSHLHYSIETAMKEALKIANSAIATGIQETVKTKLAEISASLKISVMPK